MTVNTTCGGMRVVIFAFLGEGRDKLHVLFNLPLPQAHIGTGILTAELPGVRQGGSDQRTVSP